jgi:drug/metabolite transporter (DMT)-like permease
MRSSAVKALLVAGIDWPRYLGGAGLALLAVACWTWYPLKNADWLRDHRGRNPRSWATAQGLATLPLAILFYGLFWLWQAGQGAAFAMPFGPRPLIIVATMLVIGFFASWLGTLCWNEASQRLPTNRAGQLILFETLAALLYAYLLRGAWPPILTIAGIACLVIGVVLASRITPTVN